MVENRKLWTFDFVFACIANFLMGFSFYLLMPTLPFYLAEHFGADKSTIGLIVSCYVIAALIIRPLSGFLVDSFSRKWVYLISYAAFFLFSIGYLIAGTIVLMFVLRFLHGLTWGVITTAGNTLAIDIMPSEKRGRGIGFYGMALNISMAVGPMAGLFLYQHHPFDVLFYLAIITGFIGMLFAFLIKAPHHQPVKHHKAFSLDRFLMLKGIPMGVNVMLITLSYGMILSFAAMYSKDTGATNPGLFFTLLAIGLGGARALSGKMIDNGRINQASLIGIAILVVGFIAFVTLRQPLVYYLSALVLGIGYGVSFPSFQTGFVNMATHHQRGTANSTFLTAFDTGVGIGMLAAGQIAQMSSLATAFAFSGMMCLVGFFYYQLVSKHSYKKNRLEA
jgi:MFS family permease